MTEESVRSKLIVSLSLKGCLVSLVRDLSLGWDLSLKRRMIHRNRMKISRSKKCRSQEDKAGQV